jgi:hypothetical protein
MEIKETEKDKKIIVEPIEDPVKQPVQPKQPTPTKEPVKV